VVSMAQSSLTPVSSPACIGMCKFLPLQTAKVSEGVCCSNAVVLPFIALPPMDPEGATSKSVIKDYELAEAVYATAFLYAVNKCHCKAKDIWILLTGSHTPNAFGCQEEL
jgi:hypothetical protein